MEISFRVNSLIRVIIESDEKYTIDRNDTIPINHLDLLRYNVLVVCPEDRGGSWS
jgi:hypothetical protein